MKKMCCCIVCMCAGIGAIIGYVSGTAAICAVKNNMKMKNALQRKACKAFKQVEKKFDF